MLNSSRILQHATLALDNDDEGTMLVFPYIISALLGLGSAYSLIRYVYVNVYTTLLMTLIFIQ